MENRVDLTSKFRTPSGPCPKPGDIVRIKSLEWYNRWKDHDGYIGFDTLSFTKGMSRFCGQTMVIMSLSENGKYYRMAEDDGMHDWSPVMFEEVLTPGGTLDVSANFVQPVHSLYGASSCDWDSMSDGIPTGVTAPPIPWISVPQMEIKPGLWFPGPGYIQEAELQTIKKHRFIKLEKL